MTMERLIKRTVWVAKCECGKEDVKENSAPRAHLCKCGKWADYEERSVIGPDLGLEGYKRK